MDAARDLDHQEYEEITITSVWHATTRVEVPKGWRPPSTLDGWPDGVLDQVDTTGAELVDWDSPS